QREDVLPAGELDLLLVVVEQLALQDPLQGGEGRLGPGLVRVLGLLVAVASFLALGFLLALVPVLHGRVGARLLRVLAAAAGQHQARQPRDQAVEREGPPLRAHPETLLVVPHRQAPFHVTPRAIGGNKPSPLKTGYAPALICPGSARGGRKATPRA